MSFHTLAYNQSLALLTDLYQLTMAYGYWKSGMDKQEAVFHLFYRTQPFGGGFSVACGLAYAMDYLDNFRFDDSDLRYLSDLRGNDERPLFDRKFLDYLRQLKFQCDVDAIPEGTVVFAHEPLVRVQGPILQCQLLETILLNIINFQTLIATKAARVTWAAQGQSVLEFGLRRAQGMDGALAASRAAYIGGCAATSNVLAGKIFGIPVRGTHAHSWVMAFGDEEESFMAFAQAMPNNGVFLVDTYETLEGVRRAIRAGEWLRRQGHEMVGIRLDSGDLAYLSQEARRMLDEAGFPNAKIIASNELDETLIQSLKDQGARVDIWGVGTRLVTGHDQPALGGVYKLSAIRPSGGEWSYRVKLSEQSVKVSNPGILQVRRYRSQRENLADVIFDVRADMAQGCRMVDPLDGTRRKTIARGTAFEDLLVPIFRQGRGVYTSPTIQAMRRRTGESLAAFHAGIKRFVNPHQYPVGIEESLNELKTALIRKHRGHGG